ncbi:uncharacterized protein LOC123227266 [Mangifera indica]|uniref:uncharacterized protein LOC123227266 n=1 Tax=Mangifera indica TaxID=29780 RepID=UPI001CFC3182|nr:uncharacterized protein LOC123227266 [Mangifera indica]
MQTSIGLGFMAVFAVSGSVVLLANQVNKRLLSDFMKKIEFEISGSEKFNSKKKVRFAEDVMEPSSNNKEYRKRSVKCHQMMMNHHLDDSMPLNRLILYKGILQYRALQAQKYSIM